MVDNEQHIELFENQGQAQPWDVFVKIDVGSHRAGVSTASPSLRKLVNRAEASQHVNLIGFYCHAGHSYAGRSPEEAEATLHAEISGVLDAASLLPASRKLTVSIGATPTAHVVKSLKATIPSNIRLELHAGKHHSMIIYYGSSSLIRCPTYRQFPHKRPTAIINTSHFRKRPSRPRCSRSLQRLSRTK